MTPSNEFYRLLKLFEGCKLDAYRCPANVVTIGYGSISDIKGNSIIMGSKISLAEAEALLKNEVDKKAKYLNKELGKTEVTQNQFDALVSFAYNVGTGALKKSTLLKKVNADPNDKFIESQFLIWNKVKGVPVKGLTQRRQAESKLYFS
jgi:lysozyme